MACPCEQSTKPSGFIKGGEISRLAAQVSTSQEDSTTES